LRLTFCQSDELHWAHTDKMREVQVRGSLYTGLDYWTDNNYKYNWDVRGMGLDRT